MVSIRTVLDALIEKGIVSEGELRRRSLGVRERLKPKNFLTEEELKEVQAALDAMEVPSPTGWAHALYLHAIKEAKNQFSPERTYCSCCLRNLSSTLSVAGLRDEVIFRKLRDAASMAERYGIESCIF